MARGKFNKRGGGKRVDAQSADEIEQRNQRLAEFEENRAKRRAEEEEAQNGGGEDDEEEDKDDKKKDDDKDKAPAVVTTEEDHKRNLAKLEIVRKRREAAAARKKAEQEAALAQELEQKAALKAHQEDDSDDDDDKKKKKKSKKKEIPKLTKIEMKKMKPAQMKEGKCSFQRDWGMHDTPRKCLKEKFFALVSHPILFVFETVSQRWKKEALISKETKMLFSPVLSSTKRAVRLFHMIMREESILLVLGLFDTVIQMRREFCFFVNLWSLTSFLEPIVK